MAYKWLGMRAVTWEKIKELHEKGELAGYYRLYSDNTERQIGDGYTWEDILQHYDNGGGFGEEIDTVELALPGGKIIKAPVVVDISSRGCLEELEYELWHTIEQYLALFGIRTEDDQPDWATVKTVQYKIIDVLEDAGVEFKILDRKMEQIKQSRKGAGMSSHYKEVKNGNGTELIISEEEYISAGRKGEDVMIRGNGKVMAFKDWSSLIDAMDSGKADYRLDDKEVMQR